MALTDMLHKARVAARRAARRHRGRIDSGITKIGDLANTKTAGRYQDQIAQGSSRARAGLDKATSEPSPGERSDPDAAAPAGHHPQ